MNIASRMAWLSKTLLDKMAGIISLRRGNGCSINVDACTAMRGSGRIVKAYRLMRWRLRFYPE